MERYYLAYGSNLNKGQMAFRCPDAIEVGVGEIKGYRLLFRGSKTGSYLTIEPSEGCSVPVAVWDVTRKDEKALDRYEGFPKFYKKVDFDVTVTSKHGLTWEQKCFAYVMDRRHKPELPTVDYFRTCLQGYVDFGFDNDVLVAAVNDTSHLMDEENEKGE